MLIVDGRIVIGALYLSAILSVRVVFFQAFIVGWGRCGRSNRLIVPHRARPRWRVPTSALPQAQDFQGMDDGLPPMN